MAATKKGYFEVEFSIKNKDGKKIIAETYKASIKGKKAEFSRKRYSVAVIPPPLPMKSRASLMGISDQFESRYVKKDLYKFADRLGFSFCRIHSIGWGAFFSDASRAIEPEPGKYNWTELDNHINSMKKYGFEIVGNIMYTPTLGLISSRKNLKTHLCSRVFRICSSPNEILDRFYHMP